MQAPHTVEDAGKLLIIGASCRAAATSATAAGWQVFAADMFADEDLAAICCVEQVKNYPAGLIDAAAHFPPSPYIYTGALENHPELLGEVSKHHTLYGCDGDALAAIRDPYRWTEVLAAANLHHLPVAKQPPAKMMSGEWLAKKHFNTCYWQRFQAGESHSAVYLAQNGGATLVGVTQQLVGETWANAAPYSYCGSIGPILLSAERKARWEAIGKAFAAELPLSGLFGVDAIVGDAPNEVFPVEINPRYTASCEIHERAAPQNSAWRSLVNLHIAACERRLENEPIASRTGVFGKAILFAPKELLIDASWHRKMQTCEIADVPAKGTTIEQGNPICTIYSQGNSAEDALHHLKDLCYQSYCYQSYS